MQPQLHPAACIHGATASNGLSWQQQVRLFVLARRDSRDLRFILQAENQGSQLFYSYLQSLRHFVDETWEEQDNLWEGG